MAIQRLFVQNFMYCNMKTKISDLKTFLLIKFSKVGLTTFVCESKTYLTFLNPRWLFWNKNDKENVSRCHQIWNPRTTKKVMEVSRSSVRTFNLTFFVVLRFQIWWLESIDFSSVWFGLSCNIGWVTIGVAVKSEAKNHKL